MLAPPCFAFPPAQVHWFSIVNSLLVVLVMATIVAMILVRTVRRDLAKYEALVVDGAPGGPGAGLDAKDEAGWKLVAGDAFRAPTSSSMLAVQVGLLLCLGSERGEREAARTRARCTGNG